MSGETVSVVKLQAQLTPFRGTYDGISNMNPKHRPCWIRNLHPFSLGFLVDDGNKEFVWRVPLSHDIFLGKILRFVTLHLGTV